jgi:TolA-binding protein
MEKSLPSDIGNNKQLESKEEKNEKQDTQLKENIENNEGKINELEERKREIEIRMKEEKEKMEKERERIEREREIRIKEEKEKMEREIEKERRAEIERREKEIREKEIRERGVGCKGCEWFFNNRKKYFPSTPYNGYSIVDGLRAIGADSSFDYRTQIAIKNGINDYVGSPNQNLHMLDLLKLGKLLRP